MKRLAKKIDAMYNQVSQSLFSGVNACNINGSPEELAEPVRHGCARSAVGGGQPKSSCIKTFGLYISRNNCSNANYCSCCCRNNRHY